MYYTKPMPDITADVQTDTNITIAFSTYEYRFCIQCTKLGDFVKFEFSKENSNVKYSFVSELFWDDFYSLPKTSMYSDVYNEFFSHVTDDSRNYTSNTNQVSYKAIQAIKSYKRLLPKP